MSYTALPTKSPGDLLTSALWNTYLQGNADSGFMRMIADTTLGSPAATVDFTSIPQTFAHLLMVCVARTSSATAGGDLYGIRINGDTGTNYDYVDPGGGTGTGATSAKICGAVGGGATANLFATAIVWIPYYRGATNRHQFLAVNGLIYGNTGVSAQYMAIGVGSWRTNATAITQLTLTGVANNFVADSRFTLYGIPQ